MWESKRAYRILVGNLREGYHLEDPGLDERIILKWMFVKWDRLDLDLAQDVGTGGGLL
jgi:hypothetical protein